jgi:prepilin-type N-terminal cleavage/methylation domain-containing protein
MRNAKRAGFTLVELMVAMALTLFVMVILSQAFVTSLDTFSGMKGIGDMQQNLRTAGNILKNDLSQYHFEGARRLSDTSAGLPLIVPPTAGGPAQGLQPQAGFLAVLQGSAPVLAGAATSLTPYVNEGQDSNGVPSFRAHDHIIYLSVNRKGNRQENFFTASLQDVSATGANLGLFFGPANPTAYDLNPTTQLPFYTWAPPYVSGSTSAFYSSQWAEVVYYLKRTGSTEEPNNPLSAIGTPTFGLYRAQFVMVPDSSHVSGILANGLELTTFEGMSCNKNNTTGFVDFFSPSDASAYVTGQTPVVKRLIPQVPQFTPGAAAVNVATNRVEVNEALLLPNVLSFHVQIMPTTGSAFGDVPATNVPPANGVAQPAAFLYDTALISYANYGNTFGLKGIQVTLRVFDNASRQARQMTIVQDL